MAIELCEIAMMSQGELETIGLDFTEELDSDQTIYTVAAVEVETDDHAATGDLVLDQEQSNAAAFEKVIDGVTSDVEIGKAALMAVEGPLAGTVYKVRVTVEVVVLPSTLTIRRLVRDFYIACVR